MYLTHQGDLRERVHRGVARASKGRSIPVFVCRAEDPKEDRV
jgi:hypothetical protein